MKLPIIALAILAWIWLIYDLFKKTVLVVDPGRLQVEKKWLRLRVVRTVQLEDAGLELYQVESGSNGMMTVYGLRPVGKIRGLAVHLDHSEATVLKRMIESVVL